MSQVTLSCPHCGATVTLPVRRLVLELSGTAGGGVVLFTCLMCDHSAALRVDASTVGLLLAAGSAYVSLQEPEPDGHPETAPDGPPLTLDDLLDLHQALSDDQWVGGFPVTEGDRP